MGNQDVTAGITEVSAVAIPVSDQDRALEFYTKILGFEKRLDAPFGGGRWVSVAPPGGTAEIALVGGDQRTAASAHTGIRLSTPDADALHAHLHHRGADTDPEGGHSDGRIRPPDVLLPRPRRQRARHRRAPLSATALPRS